MAPLLGGVLLGVAGTLTMDALGFLSQRIGLAPGARPQWVGRWYLGIPKGQFVHANIATAPAQPGETRAALAGHYIIGIVLGVLYVLGVKALDFSPASIVTAVGYGLMTCVFPWFLVYPALGFGAFGRRGPPELGLSIASLVNHFFYGLGLWWVANLLRLGP